MKWLVIALAVMIAAYVLPGIHVSGFYAALITAAFIGLFNLIIRPLILILTLPINVLTLGLFTFVINGFLLWLISTFVKGFTVDNFFWGILGGIIITLVQFFANKLFDEQ